MTNTSNQSHLIISSFVLVSFVIFLSSPGWTGDFWFDDFSNIVNNSALKIQNLDLASLYEASSPIAGGPGMTRPVSYISFAVNFYWSGMDPYYFKLTNTIIHAVNAILFFFLSIRIIQLIKKSAGIQENHILWLAFCISLFWAITPMNVTSSLYIVQRMNELSALFIILGCLLYLHIRTKSNQTLFIQIIYLFLFILILALAGLSKENGVLLVPLCLCIELLIRSENKSSISNNTFFYLFCLFLLILPLIYIFIHYFNHIINLTQTSSYRGFSALERLFTQFRIVTVYAKQTFFPDIYQLTLLHDGYEKSTSLFEPITTLLSLMFWTGLSVLAFYFRKIAPWFIFGLLWFFVAHSIESTILPLELMFEHRNYTPSYGLIFAAIISVYVVWMKALTSPFRLRAPTFGEKGGLRGFKAIAVQNHIFVFFTIYLLVLGMNTFFVTNIWGNTSSMFKVFVENNPTSARAHLSWADLNARVYKLHPEKKEYFEEAIKSYTAATRINQNLIGGLTASILLKNDFQVNFDNEVEHLFQRLRTIQPNPTFIINTRNFTANGFAGDNKLSDELIENYFKIIFNSQKVKGKYKGMLYREYADYLYRKNGMKQVVIDYLKKSIEAYPGDIKLKIYYTKALIAAKQYKSAEEILNILYKMDKLGRYTEKLDKIKLIIQSYYKSK